MRLPYTSPLSTIYSDWQALCQQKIFSNLLLAELLLTGNGRDEIWDLQQAKTFQS